MLTGRRSEAQVGLLGQEDLWKCAQGTQLEKSATDRPSRRFEAGEYRTEDTRHDTGTVVTCEGFAPCGSGFAVGIALGRVEKCPLMIKTCYICQASGGATLGEVT